MPTRPAIVTGLAAGALLAVASAPALGAIAALQDDQLVSASVSTLDARLDALKATNARVGRFDIFWSEVAPTKPANPTDPADPAYNWTRADAAIGGMLARGIRPIVSVYSTPRWSSGGLFNPVTQFNPYAPGSGDYGRFMSAVATRYSGRYVVPQTGVKLPEVRHYEVWNEPNLNIFFRKGSRTSLGAYLQLVREAYPAIKAADPRAIVIAGVGGPRSTSGADGIGARQWLQGIVRSPLNVKFDAYSQHVYPSAAPNAFTKAFPSWSSINEILATLDQRRAREIAAAKGAVAKAKLRRAPKMRLFITEAGYTTLPTTYRKVVVSEAQQAQYLRQIFALKQVRTPRVPVIVWFNKNDNPDWPGGLFREDGSAKPAYAAFQSVARRGTLPADLRR